jgi:hypothetical protein
VQFERFPDNRSLEAIMLERTALHWDEKHQAIVNGIDDWLVEYIEVEHSEIRIGSMENLGAVRYSCTNASSS